MANLKKPKMQEVKEVGTPRKSTNYQWAQREAVEELRKQEEEELFEQTRSGEMGGEEGRKEEKIEKEEMNKKERKRRSLKATTLKKKSERAKTPLCAQGKLTPAEAQGPSLSSDPTSGRESGGGTKISLTNINNNTNPTPN